MSKLITVFGSTGQQGGSVLRALLSNGNFKVRALVRNPDSDASKKLKELGAEVVKSDDSDSKEHIESALKGSYGVFLVTNFWSYFDKEYEYGKKIADAALSAGIKHIVFSGLAPCKKISNGRYNVPHFDLKHQVEEHIRSLSAANPSFVSSFVYAPLYAQNFQTSFTPKKNEDGLTYTISFPSDPSGKLLDVGDVNDIGSIVAGIFSDPTKYSGSIVPFSGDALTGNQIADTISKVTGKKVSFNYIPPSVFRTFGFPGADELATMFEYYNEFGAFNDLDKSIAPKIHKLTTFEQFLNKVNYKLE
ncbi:hypothetical protein RB653_006172 [Dictyostelium firmibasis]|uniref:NmrA-like family domain-containing protein 1 n=1 Tax=Dictyostelium firmibasis TaxID=79012 RepID=A0AAN7U2H4_9MYCE